MRRLAAQRVRRRDTEKGEERGSSSSCVKSRASERLEVAEAWTALLLPLQSLLFPPKKLVGRNGLCPSLPLLSSPVILLFSFHRHRQARLCFSLDNPFTLLYPASILSFHSRSLTSLCSISISRLFYHPRNSILFST